LDHYNERLDVTALDSDSSTHSYRWMLKLLASTSDQDLESIKTLWKAADEDHDALEEDEAEKELAMEHSAGSKTTASAEGSGRRAPDRSLPITTTT